ncbi:hypothetical protein [Haladaptatus sp. DFWS20]|uniref:hypothetical protein n=1 Tax=Haladaptatus sp. DFWS20 TaxID=3403467 RepID=UPI003EC078CD
MCGDNNTPTRRTVLKGFAAGTTALAVPASASPSGRGRSLAGKRVFLESNLDLELPATVETTGRLVATDVLLVSADTTVPRGRLVSSAKRGAPITFVGDGADDALASLLYDVRPSAVADTARAWSLEKPTDLSASFGIEYDQHSQASVAVAWPRGSTIDTHQYRTDTPSPEHALSRIDRTFELNGATASSLTTSDVGTNDAGEAMSVRWRTPVPIRRMAGTASVAATRRKVWQNTVKSRSSPGARKPPTKPTRTTTTFRGRPS